MKIIRAQVLGFCMGVRRAVEMALEASAKPLVKDPSGSRKVYTLGPLIHNQKVLEILQERGIICLEESGIPELDENAVVIIRAHGVSPLAENVLAKQGAHVLDATCPYVKQSQSKARSFAEKGYHVFLAGEEGHGEIAGIKGFVDDAIAKLLMKPLSDGNSRCFVVASPAEAESAAGDLFNRTPLAKTALIGQTTIGPEEYIAIGEKIRKYFPSLEIVNSICSATKQRQEALRELCKNTDAVVIAGGRKSANTQRLLALAKELEKPGWLVETVSDIPPEIKAFKTIGLSAGASTPDELIGEIEEALKAK